LGHPVRFAGAVTLAGAQVHQQPVLDGTRGFVPHGYRGAVHSLHNSSHGANLATSEAQLYAADMTLPVVGLTGGIASGKSTVARSFEALGVPVIDADQLAREAVAKGSEGLGRIVEVFGPEVLLPDGTLDRKALGQRVFNDPEARATLNAITHPRIAALSAEKIRTLSQAAAAPYVLYEAALIVENALHRNMHALVVVSTDVGTQLERLMKRDGLNLDEAEARVRAQYPLEKKLEVADYVIENRAEAGQLAPRVRDVHEALVARFAGRP
jgi:dephospho-CoA kinase